MSSESKTSTGSVNVMTWAEICAAYPDEWLVLDHLVEEEEGSLRIRAANVAARATSRKEAWAAAGRFMPGPVAVRTTGAIKVPKGFYGLFRI